MEHSWETLVKAWNDAMDRADEEVEQGKFVRFDEHDEFHCVCGNYPNAEGAYPSDVNGGSLGDCKIITMFCCDRCGKVFDANTGEVVGQRKEETYDPHADGMRKDHRTDSDCAGHIDSTTNLCSVCGVLHGDPCLDCGGRGFHVVGCGTEVVGQRKESADHEFHAGLRDNNGRSVEEE